MTLSTRQRRVRNFIHSKRLRLKYLEKHPEKARLLIESFLLHGEYIALRSMRGWADFDDAEFYCGSWMGEGREAMEFAILGAEKIPEVIEMLRERKKGHFTRRKIK